MHHPQNIILSNWNWYWNWIESYYNVNCNLIVKALPLDWWVSSQRWYIIFTINQIWFHLMYHVNKSISSLRTRVIVIKFMLSVYYVTVCSPKYKFVRRWGIVNKQRTSSFMVSCGCGKLLVLFVWKKHKLRSHEFCIQKPTKSIKNYLPQFLLFWMSSFSKEFNIYHCCWQNCKNSNAVFWRRKSMVQCIAHRGNPTVGWLSYHHDISEVCLTMIHSEFRSSCVWVVIYLYLTNADVK